MGSEERRRQDINPEAPEEDLWKSGAPILMFMILLLIGSIIYLMIYAYRL